MCLTRGTTGDLVTDREQAGWSLFEASPDLFDNRQPLLPFKQRALAAGDQCQGHYITSVSSRLGHRRSRHAHRPCRGPGSTQRQAVALRQEGVTVSTGTLGELMVDFGTFGWFPSSLPSEGSASSEAEAEAEAEADEEGNG